MEFELFSAAAIVFAIVCFANQIFDIRKKKSICISNIFGFMFGVTYGVLPAAIVLSYYLNGEIYRRIRYSDERMNELWLWFILAVVGYLFFRFAYRIKTDGKDSKIVDCKTIEADRFADNRKLQITSAICLVIGLISLHLWSRAYGGVLNLIEVANQVRSGDLIVNNPFTFFKHPARLLTFSSYATVKLLKNQYRKELNWCMLVVSAISSVLLLLACDGRMSMGIYFVIMFLVATDMFGSNIKFGRKIAALCLVGLIGMVVIMNMDAVTYLIRTGKPLDRTSSSSTLLDEFAYIIMSAQNASHLWLEDGTPLLIGQDVLSGLFAWVPNSLKPGNFVNIWNYNTLLCYNADLSSAQIPSDFVSTAIYDLGIFGTPIFAFLAGMIIRKLDDIHKSSNNLFYEVAYYSLAMVVLRYVNYCMLYDLILSLFYLFVAYVVWKGVEIVLTKGNKSPKKYIK